MTGPHSPDTPSPQQPPEVLAAVRLARSGQQAQAARQLGGLADSPDPLTAWTATAALLPWLWWNGENTTAVRRVDQTMAAVAFAAERAELPEVSTFFTAFAAAAYYDGVDVAPPLEAALAGLPAAHPQRRLFDATWRRVVSDPASLLPARVPDPEPMLAGQTALAARGPAALSSREVETVLLEAINCGQRDLVLQWIDAGVPVPDRSWTLLWVAEMLLERGRPEPVEQLLVREARAWEPFEWWDTTSWQIPLSVVTRGLVTPAVRSAHLEQPVAEGVS